MASLIRLIFWSITTFCVIFLLYGVITIKSYKKKKYIRRVPEPFNSLFNKLYEMPLLNSMMDRYMSDFYLIKGSKDLGKLYVAVYCSIIPAISVLLIMIAFLSIHTWYFSLLVSFCCIVIPYLKATNVIREKSLSIKSNMIRSYESSERYFSDKSQVLETFQEITRNSTGSVKLIYKNFCTTYPLERDKAYADFKDTVGDKFSAAFINSVQLYDEYGIDPCIEISNQVRMAIRHYNTTFVSLRGVKSYRVLTLITLGLAIIFAFGAVSVASILHKTVKGEFLTYSSIAGVLYCYLLCLMYERQ